MELSREQVLSYRVTAQQLDRDGSAPSADTAILDLGVQDTGPDGAAWAFANRGAAPDPKDLVLTWTLRGAPHFYRRADIAAVAAATAPFSEADAAKRIFDAAKPLRAAGINPLDALDVVAGEMKAIVTRPTAKGEMSSRLTERLSDPYLRYCRSCQATHCYEQPFRLGALGAGLELQPDTSPPVLQRIKGWKGPAATAPERLDVVRGYLHLFGPATARHVADYVDAPVKDVKQHWPEDVTEVSVDGETRWALSEDLPDVAAAAVDPGRVRLLSPFDLFLQNRDRELLVPEVDRRKELWKTLGRPGGVLAGCEVVGTWRPRVSGKKLRLLVDLWAPVTDGALAGEGERLAAHRGLTFAGLTDR